MLKPPAAWFLGEICVANQDLILLVDGSGSLKEDGFAILRTFAANLTTLAVHFSIVRIATYKK